MNSALEKFAEEVERPEEDLRLEVAALWIGAISNEPLAELDSYLSQLDQFAELTKAKLNRLDLTPWSIARAVAQTLFIDLKFRGNTVDYYNPNNSFLHHVLTSRLGLPITLSVLYIEVARRVELVARGVGFPGHFLVRIDSADDGPLFLDPFHGGVELDNAGLNALLAQRNGAGAQVEPAMLEPISKNALLRRMLFNLAGIYGQLNDWHRSLAVLERLSLLDPNNPRIEQELGGLRARIRTLN